MKQIKLKNLSQDEVWKILPDNLLFLGYRGSIAHGMYVPNSNPDSIDDKDLIGAFTGPIEYYLGLEKIKESREKLSSREKNSTKNMIAYFIRLCDLFRF